MHCMDGTDLNITQLTAIMFVMGTMTVEMKKDVVCDVNCIHDLSM